MTLGSNNSVELFAQRMDRRAKVLPKKVAALMRVRFKSMANKIFLYNPVWSSQSVVNWTASIGHGPLTRLVNVDKLGDPNVEGNMGNIVPHSAGKGGGIAGAASSRAWGAAEGVASKYKAKMLKGSGKSPSIWLTNNVSYTGKLWRGWPTNRWKGGLKAIVSVTKGENTSIKVWQF